MRTGFTLVGLNLVGALSGFAATWVIVWEFGLSPFAGYAVDLARLSLVLLAVELLPSNFSLFRQQTDPQFAAAYPAFYAAAGVLLPMVAAALIQFGAFDLPSWFMLPYIALAVVQRYLDCQLQARGELSDYLRIPAVSNILRLCLLGAVVIGWAGDPIIIADLLWGSLSLSMLLSLLVASRRHIGLLFELASASRAASWRELWDRRRLYTGYYLNSVLKRLKDTALPLACDALLPRSVTGLVLVIYRAVDAAFGQLRLLESVFTNLAARARLLAERSQIALTAAVVGQFAAIAASAALLWREGLGLATLGPALLFSFAVYPYVAELLARSDSLAAGAPRRVTTALITYLLVFGAALTAGCLADMTSAAAILAGLLLAQVAAAASYYVRALPLVGRKAAAP